jgi:hypothetical protein
MPAADSSGPDEAPKFRSPKRTLARAFRLSRDRWKAKATQRREQLRDLKVRLRDVEVSRDLWKQKALYLQEQLDHRSGLSSAPGTEDAAADSAPPSVQAAGPQLGSSAAAPAATALPPTSAEPVKKKRRR